MKMSNDSAGRILFGLISACAVLGAAPAFAGSASFGIAPAATSATTNGTSISSTVALPANGTNGFAVNFVLPQGYKKNAPFDVTFYLQTASPDCTVRIEAYGLVRKRIGRNLASGVSGVSAVAGSPTRNLPANGVVKPVTIEIAPGNEMNGQKAGDSMTLSLRRPADAQDDTCSGSVFIQAINVIYPTS